MSGDASAANQQTIPENQRVIQENQSVILENHTTIRANAGTSGRKGEWASGRSLLREWSSPFPHSPIPTAQN